MQKDKKKTAEKKRESIRNANLDRGRDSVVVCIAVWVFKYLKKKKRDV